MRIINNNKGWIGYDNKTKDWKRDSLHVLVRISLKGLCIKDYESIEDWTLYKIIRT